jgi:hypothetical protein
MRRPLVALCASVALSVLALALWVVVLNASPPAGQSTQMAAVVAASGSKYCSNWDFVNNTGHVATGLQVRLAGVQSVSSVYTGTMNPFVPPDGIGNYDSGANVYHLDFGNGTVNESDMVHIGICTVTPTLRLDAQGATPPFHWVLSGTLDTPQPMFTGIEFAWPSPAHLRLHVVNEQNVTTTLMSAQLLDAGLGLSLDDLNATVVDQLPMVLDMLPSPQTLAPQSDTFFDVNFDAPGGGAPPDHAQILNPPYLYVLETVLVSEADPTDSAHLFAQALAPFIPLYLPIIQR